MINSTAIIAPSAKIADGVKIGAYACIGPDVEIGEGTEIGPHVVIQGPCRIGKHNKIYQFASLGEVPQDKKFQGEHTELVIGDHNVIREYCNFNRGTAHSYKTQIGNRNLFMANVHIAHDCVVGNDIIMANNSSLAGHVQVRDFVILSGYIGVHQFCLIGEHAFVSHGMLITQDVPPYLMVAGGRRQKTSGINSEGLKRRGFSGEAIRSIKEAYKILYMRGLPLNQAIEQLTEMAKEHPVIQAYVDFFAVSKRGMIA